MPKKFREGYWVEFEKDLSEAASEQKTIWVEEYETFYGYHNGTWVPMVRERDQISFNRNRNINKLLDDDECLKRKKKEKISE